MIDVVTGKRGVVRRGGKDGSTGDELYRVEFADATYSFRTSQEIELDASMGAATP